jgi:hypothetical protein
MNEYKAYMVLEGNQVISIFIDFMKREFIPQYEVLEITWETYFTLAY